MAMTLPWTFAINLVFVACVAFCHNATGSNVGSLPTFSVADHFHTFLKSLNQSGSPTSKNLLQEVSSECEAHLTGWAMNLGSMWSIQMLDAMSKIPEGMLSGHSSALGDFDECLMTRGEVEIGDVQSSFKGQYCLVNTMQCEQAKKSSGEVRAMLSHNYDRLGQPQASQGQRGPLFELGVLPGGALCVPSKCSAEDLQSVLMAALNGTGICISINGCQTDDKPKLRSGDIVMITILAVIGALCFVGTAVDLAVYGHASPSKPVQSIIAFSVYTNTKKWLSTKAGSDNLGCIHGIRFLSTCWVVLAHTWSTWLVKVWNLLDMLFINEDWTVFPILNGTVSVDTFFTLAGLLAAYSVLKMLDKTKGKLNVPMLYLHRYLRLTPTYAILVGIMATLFENLRRGPHSTFLAPSGESCRYNWWHNLLYINNLMKYDDTEPSKSMCHGESWYLANDMQFFLISPLLLWPLWKWRFFGYILMGGFAVASIVVPTVVTYVYELNPTLLLVSGNFETISDFMGKSYIKPWMRFGPYIVGLWAGYILYVIRKRRTPLKLPALVVVLGWATSTAVALAIIFAPMSFFDPASKYDRLGSAFYAGFHRFGWGMVISWIVLACTMGYGGIINTFLSWKAFVPLGRLSFCVYLISFWLQQMYYMSDRQYTHYDLYTGINFFFAHMVMSLLVSFVACMVFESPFIALEKIIFQDGNTKAPVKQTSEKSEPAPEAPEAPEAPDQSINMNEKHVLTA